MNARLVVVDGGPQTSVQDLGRPGFQALGVPPSGALDAASLRLANLILGNNEGAAALELRLAGPTLRIGQHPVRVALAGSSAALGVTRANGTVEEWASWRGVDLYPGDTLRVGGLGDTATAYLAFSGGISVPPVMGSRSTCLLAGFSGYHGRALRAGDEIGCGLPLPGVAHALLNIPAADRLLLRFVPGPQADHFAPEAFIALTGHPFRIGRDISRMGVRLDGPELVRRQNGPFVSDGTAPGSVQVTGSGQAIVLLADRGTTGGYPKIATVISADVTTLGRALPGTEIRFTEVDVEEAEAAAFAAEDEFRSRAGWIAPLLEPWSGR